MTASDANPLRDLNGSAHDHCRVGLRIAPPTLFKPRHQRMRLRVLTMSETPPRHTQQQALCRCRAHHLRRWRTWPPRRPVSSGVEPLSTTFGLRSTNFGPHSSTPGGVRPTFGIIRTGFVNLLFMFDRIRAGCDHSRPIFGGRFWPTSGEYRPCSGGLGKLWAGVGQLRPNFGRFQGNLVWIQVWTCRPPCTTLSRPPEAGPPPAPKG